MKHSFKTFVLGGAVLLTAGISSAQRRDADFAATLGSIRAETQAEAAGARAAAAQAKPDRPAFDYYMLALSWESAFCETHDRPECAGVTTDSFAGNNLVLHGLWPNKNNDPKHTVAYCGVPESIRKLDQAGAWSDMPALIFQPQTEKDLTAYMPGHSSYLERHEWYVHGTCSGMDPDTYFEAAASLVPAFALTSVGKYLSNPDHVGRPVPTEDLFRAFESDFGPGSRASMRVSCSVIDGRQTLGEIWVTLASPLAVGKELKDMIVRGEDPGRGNCPETLFIDPARPAAR